MKKGKGSRESIRSDGFLALEHLMYEPFLRVSFRAVSCCECNIRNCTKVRLVDGKQSLIYAVPVRH